VFMREDRESFGFNISSAAKQRMPTSAALIPRKVESLLLRHFQCTLSGFAGSALYPRYR
jgi:hypothetical protein